MQGTKESNQTDPKAAAKSRSDQLMASAVEAAASLDELVRTQAARIVELEKQLSQAQAELVDKNAIIAEKDRFIVETVTHLSENVEKLLGASDLNSTQFMDNMPIQSAFERSKDGRVKDKDTASSNFFGK